MDLQLSLDVSADASGNAFADATEHANLRISINHNFYLATVNTLPWTEDRFEQGAFCIPAWILETLCFDFMSLNGVATDASPSNLSILSWTLTGEKLSQILEKLEMLGCNFAASNLN